MMWTIEKLKHARESEDKVEFKEAKRGYKYNVERRSILGYVVAFANEGGGTLVLGMADKWPHHVVGTECYRNRLGELEAQVYGDTGIRPSVYELYEDTVHLTGRVLVIEVPSRPAGKLYTFMGVPLMRVGEQILPMDEQTRKKIEFETAPDFSRMICEGATINEIDPRAVKVLQEKYAKINNNHSILSLGTEQVLNDLELLVNRQPTYAAIILLGKKDAIRKYLPNATIQMEYRNSEADISFYKRKVYEGAFFLTLEELWADITAENKSVQVREGPYMYTIPYFNEGVIREAVCNAVAHRDYRMTSETVIKFYPDQIIFTNAGGFPPGVTLSNIIIVPSTPRNRLLADVLQKTGLVERSGQGVDRIFRDTLSEGKDAPDYSGSTDHVVELRLPSVVKNQAFAQFITAAQENLPDNEKLTVCDILNLNKILHQKYDDVSPKDIRRLTQKGLISSIGKTRSTKYLLNSSYYEYAGSSIEYYRRQMEFDTPSVFNFIQFHLSRNKKLKMRELASLLEGQLSLKQLRNHVRVLCEQNFLETSGQGPATCYFLSESYKKQKALAEKAQQLGMEELRKRGELDGESPK